MKISRRRRKRGLAGKRRHVKKSAGGRSDNFGKATASTKHMSAKRAAHAVQEQLNGKLRFRAKVLLIFLILAMTIIGLFIFIENTMKPSLNSAAEIRTKEFIEKIVMNAVYTVTQEESGSQAQSETSDAVIADNGSGSDIIKVKETETGSIAFVTLNTNLLNKIGTRIAKIVNEGVSENSVQSVRISLGSLLGSRVLSQFTPHLKFDIIPVAVSDVSYTTEFESVGINQTKYKVYMKVNTEARILVPFMPEQISVENAVLIAEAVIVGEVPETYANIPQDSLSDFVS